MNIIARNKKAFFDFFILSKLEAGVVLQGAEVKCARARRVNLKDSFIKIIRGEAFIFNMHISYLETTNNAFRFSERRERKLLLHKKELIKLHKELTQKGRSMVPLSIYFNHKNILKIEVALVEGKKLHDKRESIKERDLDRERRREGMQKYG